MRRRAGSGGVEPPQEVSGKVCKAGGLWGGLWGFFGKAGADASHSRGGRQGGAAGRGH